MSAGDIDDRLGSARRLRQLREEHADLDAYLKSCDNLPIIRANIPFGAGISNDGRVRYVDNRLNTMLDGVDMSLALATHESTEWALREYAKIGVDYANDPSGHRLANRAEYEKVKELTSNSHSNDNDIWELYDEHFDPQLRRIEKMPLERVPRDLALYPYEDDEEMLDKIREAQYGNANNIGDAGTTSGNSDPRME